MHEMMSKPPAETDGHGTATSRVMLMLLVA